MPFELTCPTNTLLVEISLPEMKRRDIALTYALALRSSRTTDWHRVNQAIITRWSFTGLEWIKKQAWKKAQGQ